MTTFGASNPRAAPRVAGHLTLWVFALGILAGAFLVFLVQPLAAKLLLPEFGGSPAVWTTSLLFFQATLLAGYGWAHLTITRLGRRWQPIAQVALILLPLVVLPISLPAWTTPPVDVEPALWLLIVLAVAVGLPYLAVTTASPILQRWFAWTDHPQGRDPYFLYAAGNAGSLAGLLAYPFIVEPNLTVASQAALWTTGYLLFVVLTIIAIAQLRRHGQGSSAGGPTEDPGSLPKDRAIVALPQADTLDEARPILVRRLTWVALAFVPSSLMLGVTTYVTADLAAVPLLWVLPLGLYLITFILAFSPRNPLTPNRMAKLLPLIVVVLAAALVGVIDLSTAALIALNLAVFFVAGLLAHGRLAADRPAPAHLTEFYFLLAVGGALGGIFNALVAPLVFDTILEYPLAIVLALLLRPQAEVVDARTERRARILDLLVPTVVMVATLALLAVLSRTFNVGADGLAMVIAATGVVLLVIVRRPTRFALSMGVVLLIPLLVGQGNVAVERSFYGVNQVFDQGDFRLLAHGTTVHGGQRLDPLRALEPLTYYHQTGPFGRVMDAFQSLRPAALRVGVIGLGAGGIAAYARPGDEIVFFEIDPVVVRIAQDPSLFGYLSGAQGEVRVVLGDGRLMLAGEPDHSFDVLVLDAFSGDAPPAHLLTLEALALYESKVAEGGLLLVNASNRFVDVPAVVETGLRTMGLPAFVPLDPTPEFPPAPEKQRSDWIAASPDQATISDLREAIDGRPIGLHPGLQPWTDDFSDLVSVIRW